MTTAFMLDSGFDIAFSRVLHLKSVQLRHLAYKTGCDITFPEGCINGDFPRYPNMAGVHQPHPYHNPHA